jgi:drug/metabolite transporter (DMT)-like permease
MTSTTATDRTRALQGIGCICIGVVLFALMDAGLKVLSAHYHPFQVAFMRAAFAVPFILAVVPLQGGFASLRSPRWPVMLLRGVVGVFMICCFVYAFATMALADAYAIFFTSPLFLTALSVPMLKEKVGIHRWGAVLVGFCGVLVMVRPSGDGFFSLGALAALGGTFVYALNVIATRKLSRTESTGAIGAYFTIGMAIPVWQPLDWQFVPLLLGMGLVGSLALVAVTQAFRLGPVAMVAPFEYTSMIWAVTLGYLIWGDFPAPTIWVGCGIVMVAGLYILYREVRRSSPILENIHERPRCSKS